MARAPLRPRPLPTPGASLRRAALAALVAFAACETPGPSGPDPAVQESLGARLEAPAVRQQERPDLVPGRVLVRFRPGAAASAIAAGQGATLDRELHPGLWVAAVAPGAERAVAAGLARNPNVVYAEPDLIRAFDDPLCPECDRPADPFLEWQWNMHNDGFVDLGYGTGSYTGAVDADIDWLEAHDLLGPSPTGSVLIGILDTGIRSTHRDICGKVALQKNFYDGSANAADDHGHGTHVAGIAGACADNDGVVGVAYGPDMRFLVGKVCAADGTCAVSGIVEGLYWMADNGADVLNMSFGDVAQSQAEADALQHAADAGVLSFCAAGNEPLEPIIFPAADPNCVAVTATNWGDGRASYSSQGPEAELAAPGGDYQDFWGLSLITSSWIGADDAYEFNMGTSMATPHATGLGGLLYALGVTDAATLRACLQATTDDLGPAGRDEQFGFGRINMLAAVQAAQAGECGAPSGNQPPTAAFTVDCTDMTCAFDASGSSDGDGSIVGWTWDFGDGGAGSGEAPSHTYTAPGAKTVTLTVVDDDGASDQAVGAANPQEPVPTPVIHVADLDGSSELIRGNRWRAHLTVRVEDGDGAPTSGATVDVSWTGDASGNGSSTTGPDGVATLATGQVKGGSSVTFTVVGVSHASASYDATANTDPDGDSDGTTITVAGPGAGNQAPSAAFDVSCDGLVCGFTDTSTDDGSIAGWSWEFGDGATSTAQHPQHTYGDDGAYTVVLEVTDDGGAIGTVQQDVAVSSGGTEPPPAIVLTATATKQKGERIVTLTWENASGPVDIYRNDVQIIGADTGGYVDNLGKGGGETFTYRVCLAGGTSTCSNVETVVF